VKQLFQRNSIFIGLSLILLGVLGLALLYIPQGELHLLLCDRHTPARDIFYRYYTQVAEWFPYIVCVALLFFSRIGDGAFASAAMILSALTTQLFKNIINAPRPIKWFALNMPDVQLPLTPGVEVHSWFSFPSGHTTSFFALAFVLCVIFTRSPRSPRDHKNHRSLRSPGTYKAFSCLMQVGLFFLAALGGYSRIYLSQHFSRDVFAGILVGVIVTAVCYAVFSRYEDKKWYNYRLLSLKNQKNAKK
jgi:membrane-associated phospholipid phosphatase